MPGQAWVGPGLVMPLNCSVKYVMLSLWNFVKSYTGDNIKVAILSQIVLWEIGEKVACVFYDNASTYHGCRDDIHG